MKPDPSIRIRWSGWLSGGGPSRVSRSVVSVSAGVACPFLQYVEARAVRAHDRLVLDAQEHAWMAERTVPAIAGDHPLVHVNGLRRRRAGGAAVHFRSFAPSMVGEALMIAM